MVFSNTTVVRFELLLNAPAELEPAAIASTEYGIKTDVIAFDLNAALPIVVTVTPSI